MIDRMGWWLLLLGMACAGSPVPGPLLQPVLGPSIQVTPTEVLIVFPPEPHDFPWPRDTLADRFAGPFWNVLAVRHGQKPIAAAAQLPSLDSLRISAFRSLNEVAVQLRLFECLLDAHVMSCYSPLKGEVGVHNTELVLRITEASWVTRFNQLRPDSAWVRVDRPNRRMIINQRLPITYVALSGGA